jgi:hypothetical protein
LGRVVNGLSTELDVRKLLDRYGSPAEGTVIAYLDIATVIGHEYGSKRWWTVVSAWRRKLLREHNLCLAPKQAGESFEVKDPEGRLKRSFDGHRYGVRRVKRAGKLLVTTDLSRLPPDRRAVADHLQRRNASVILADRQARFEPRPPRAIGDGK